MSSKQQQEYEVQLELFEGPLDLLLYLVNKAEVNIVDIAVSEIVTQYLQYLDMIRDLNIDVASEYLHMAATLIRLKARELLPQQEGEELLEEDGIYNREQLIQQLLEYKKFKEAAGTLKVFESEQYGSHVRGKAEVLESTINSDDIDLGNLSIFDILSAFKRILERAKDFPAEYKHVVNVDNVKIDDKIEHILSKLSDAEEVPFEELFLGDYRKIVLVVTFMAILELVKMQQIRFRQEENFGPIFVLRQKNPPPMTEMIQQSDQTETAAPQHDEATDSSTE
ncbi:MAG: segregation/condensation protein A [Fibrobacter sp.]|nr:segregation/condensation protein A [Fibrobacter sp.]